MLSDALLFIARDWARYAASLTVARRRSVSRQLATAVHTAQWQPDELVSDLLEGVAADDPAWSVLRSQRTRHTMLEPAELTAAAVHLRWALETFEQDQLD